MFSSDKAVFQFTGPFGIPVQIGSTLILLPLIFVTLSDGREAMMFSMIFVALLILSILLHELGHAWGCLVQGIPVRRIMLYGGGGFCEHSRSASPYQQELIVAMGPIVNLVIWALASLTMPYVEDGTWAWAIYWLAQMNLFLALFNLLPVHPLDGGKLFQLGLMRLVPARTATRISGGVGLILALVWLPGMLWLYFNVGLVLFFFPPIRLHYQMLRLKG